MTDTTSPTPPAWLAVLNALTPSLNQAVTALVGVLVGILSTLGTQWATASAPPAPATKAEMQVKQVEVLRVINDPALISRIEAVEKAVRALGDDTDMAKRSLDVLADQITAMAQRKAKTKPKKASP